MTKKRMREIISEVIDFAYELWERLDYFETNDDFYTALMERTGIDEYELEQLFKDEPDELISEWDEEDEYQEDINIYDVNSYDEVDDDIYSDYGMEDIDVEEDEIEDEFNDKYYR